MMKPTPTTCMAMSLLMPNSEQAIGMSSSEPACHAGRAACAERGDHGQQDGRRQGDLDAERVGGSHGHDGDGDGRAVHVDGGAQRNGHGVHVLVKPELLAQLHVDGDVRSGGAGKNAVRPDSLKQR